MDPSRLEAARADLAFMRGLVAPGRQAQLAIGESYVAAGLIYGLQCLYHWSQLVPAWRTGPALSAAIITGFSVVFGAVLTAILRRRSGGGAGGSAGRAGAAVFGAIGVTNFAVIAIFAIVALRERSLTIWLIYPAMVLVQQGAGWLAYAMVRRVGWMLGAALAFFACAIALALSTSPGVFLGVLTFALLGVMSGAGLLLIRTVRRES